MHIEAITEQLYQLRLHSMAKELEQQQLKPNNRTLSFEERLGLMISSEILYRENRRYQTLLRLAKLREPSASIEDIDYRSNRNLNKAEFQNLTRLDFIKHHHNVLITGPTGSGKSYLACALGHAACRQGLSVRYVRLPRFMEELAIAHADGSYSRLLDSILKCDLLILDDFGLTPLLQSHRHDLFNIIEDRHNLKSIMITGQLPIKHWHEYLGEPTMADAILDRLLQNAHIIELTGSSMRRTKKTAAKEQQERDKEPEQEAHERAQEQKKAQVNNGTETYKMLPDNEKTAGDTITVAAKTADEDRADNKQEGGE